VGIWIPRDDMDEGSEQEPVSEDEEVDDSHGNEDNTGSQDSELDGNVESDHDGGGKMAGIGRFGALAINDDEEEVLDSS
jgi:hypothetical protein